MKCNFIKCRKSAELFIVIDCRMYPICRVHYRRILRGVKGDCKIEDLVRVLRSRIEKLLLNPIMII